MIHVCAVLYFKDWHGLQYYGGEAQRAISFTQLRVPDSSTGTRQRAFKRKAVKSLLNEKKSLIIKKTNKKPTETWNHDSKTWLTQISDYPRNSFLKTNTHTYEISAVVDSPTHKRRRRNFR